MVDENKTRPIIIKRIKKGGHGHHGGSWKIAFADFMTALFAIFLVLWLLLALNDQQRAGIGQYFRDPTAVHDPASPDVIDFQGEMRAPIDLSARQVGEGWVPTEEMHDLAESFHDAIMESPALDDYRDQILMDVSDDGLRIQLIDEDERSMFALGGATPLGHTREILRALAEVLADVENPISISGHTDARPFARGGADNWTLSADRANAARRTLVGSGLGSNRFAQVVGYADTVPFDAENPRDDVNRRISMTLLSAEAVRRIAQQERPLDRETDRIDALPLRPRDLLTPEERQRQERMDQTSSPAAPQPQQPPQPPPREQLDIGPEGPEWRAEGGRDLITPEERRPPTPVPEQQRPEPERW